MAAERTIEMKRSTKKSSKSKGNDVLERVGPIVDIVGKGLGIVAPHIERVVEKRGELNTVNERTVYTLKETASILKLKRVESVVQLIEDGELKGRRIGDEYRILGQAIIDFMQGGD
jgi:hypothetical protein